MTPGPPGGPGDLPRLHGGAEQTAVDDLRGAATLYIRPPDALRALLATS